MIKKDLINLLQKSELPISVPEILIEIKANKTTIYRELETLAKNKLINEIDFGDGKKRYEWKRLNHHHHLICKSCGKIEDIKINERLLMSNIINKSDFQIENHSLEFFGKCRNCI